VAMRLIKVMGIYALYPHLWHLNESNLLIH
jgi:hypothetical protein